MYVHNIATGYIVRESDNAVCVSPTGRHINAEAAAAYQAWAATPWVKPLQINCPFSSVPAWAFKKALNLMGLRPAVDALLPQLDQDAQDGWISVSNFEIDDPMLVAMAQVLEVDLRDVFMAAERL